MGRSILWAVLVFASSAWAAAPEAPMPGDFLRVESEAWGRWLDEAVHTAWTRVPLGDVLAGEFGAADIAIDPAEKLATPITFDADGLSRREALWRLGRQHGFTVRWAQQGEPRRFLGLLETEKQERVVGGVRITTMTQVMRADHDTYERWEKEKRIKEEQVIDGTIYFSIEETRDLRFDHAAAMVPVIERYKTARPNLAAQPDDGAR